MKKLLILFLFALLLMSCGPEVIEIPDDAVVAVCPQGNTFKYIYKDDVVYEFYSDGVLQDDSMLDIVQNSVDSAGTARAYLDATFQEGVCTFSTYEPE
ncbi:MAG: hypothetical protein KAU02_02930 [Tenericutes bacterium]|nr:hypothetical protein [Mycoplasmatota bacterium]